VAEQSGPTGARPGGNGTGGRPPSPHLFFVELPVFMGGLISFYPSNLMTTSQPQLSSRQLAFLLATLVAIMPLSVDAYLPSVPQIASSLAADIHQIEKSLSSFMFGVAFGQIVGGSLSDIKGRRNIALAGLCIYLAGCLGLVFVQNATQLMMLRSVQALGGGMSAVVVGALVRDNYQGREAAQMFALIGIPIAASLINLVVLTSALSSANGGMFSTGRMLFGLSRNGSAPVIFGKLNISGVPAPALLFSCAFLLIGPVLLYYQDSPIMEIFTIVTTISSVGFIFVWVMILLSYIRYRKLRPEQHTQSVYKMPGGVFMAWACMAFLVFAVYLFSRDADTAKGLMYMPVWFGVLGVLYLAKYRKKS